MPKNVTVTERPEEEATILVQQIGGVWHAVVTLATDQIPPFHRESYSFPLASVSGVGSAKTLAAHLTAVYNRAKTLGGY